jgi:small subunit ribosomal protein S8
MSAHDTIGDFLTALRNGSSAQKEVIETIFSKQRAEIARILKSEGYISDFREVTDDKGHPRLKVSLKYVSGTPALTDIQRVSKPGRRLYCKHNEIPRVLGGLGMSILTTPKGFLKDRDAKREKVGGEILCNVW